MNSEPSLNSSNKTFVPGLDFTLSSDRSQYIRRLHGRERLSATNSALNNGVLQQYGIMEITFKDPIPEQNLRIYLHSAWIKLRFHAPWVACRCASLNSIDPTIEPNSFYFSYDNTVPGANSKYPPVSHILKSWAEETVVFRSEIMTWEEWEVAFKEVYWHPSEGHSGMELHVAKGIDERRWFFLTSAPHWTTDARGLFSVVDMFYKLLTKELETLQISGATQEKVKPSSGSGYISYEHLPWGQEISRLTPAATLLIPDVGVITTSMLSSQGQSHPVQFTRPVISARHSQYNTNETDSRILISDPSSNVSDTLLNPIVLSPSSTRSLALACKKAKCTFTALMNSILVLADVEMTMRTFMDDLKEDERDENLSFMEDNWKKADVWCVPVNVADMRTHVYPRYTALHGSATTGGTMNVMFPTSHSMSIIRQCLEITNWSTREGKLSINRAWYQNPKYFWDGMVKDTQRLLKIGALQPPHAYHASSVAAESFCPLLSPESAESITGTGGVVASSLGSVERLGIFRDISPLIRAHDKDNQKSPPFLMTNLACGLRTYGSASIIVHSWEYNGRLVVNLQGSKKWQSPQMWKIFGEVVSQALYKILEMTEEDDGNNGNGRAKAVL